jgi:non-canonical (house-cleaning) NTP pyrophosphatase
MSRLKQTQNPPSFAMYSFFQYTSLIVGYEGGLQIDSELYLKGAVCVISERTRPYSFSFSLTSRFINRI